VGNETKFCENFFGKLGRPDIAKLAAGEPSPTQVPLIAFLTETFTTKTRADWKAFLEPAHICWAPLRTLKDGFDGLNTKARGTVLTDASGNRHIGLLRRWLMQQKELAMKIYATAAALLVLTVSPALAQTTSAEPAVDANGVSMADQAQVRYAPRSHNKNERRTRWRRIAGERSCRGRRWPKLKTTDQGRTQLTERSAGNGALSRSLSAAHRAD
jgi:hypothetical protein